MIAQQLSPANLVTPKVRGRRQSPCKHHPSHPQKHHPSGPGPAQARVSLLVRSSRVASYPKLESESPHPSTGGIESGLELHIPCIGSVGLQDVKRDPCHQISDDLHSTALMLSGPVIWSSARARSPQPHWHWAALDPEACLQGQVAQNNPALHPQVSCRGDEVAPNHYRPLAFPGEPQGFHNSYEGKSPRQPGIPAASERCPGGRSELTWKRPGCSGGTQSKLP